MVSVEGLVDLEEDVCLTLLYANLDGLLSNFKVIESILDEVWEGGRKVTYLQDVFAFASSDQTFPAVQLSSLSVQNCAIFCLRVRLITEALEIQSNVGALAQVRAAQSCLLGIVLNHFGF